MRFTLVVAALSVGVPAALSEPVFRDKKRAHFGLSGSDQSFTRNQRRNWFGVRDSVRLITDGQESSRKRPVDEGADPEVSAALSQAEIEDKFDLAYHFKHVDTIFDRVFT